jgi:hypothetical protein
MTSPSIPNIDTTEYSNYSLSNFPVTAGDKIAVWFSCGAASAVALQQTLLKYPDCEVHAVNNPVIEEDADNQRFADDVGRWLGVNIERAFNPKYPSGSAVEVWGDRRYMSGLLGAPCTIELKKEARRHWETAHKPDWHVLGFTVDEAKRYQRFITNERDNVLPVLIDAGLTKENCFQIITDAGLQLPRMYHLGFPNSNCVGCPKATSATYWSAVKKEYPDVFAARAAMSREIGARLVRYKGERMFLDELPEGAKGRPMKSMQIECGIFCEEIE